ncbi:MAG: DUF3122 domain-containing protein [Oscillatoriales cyanobacterium SM2_2_1]|nr:DUF3122 domain-containing protein [Oscillatoriales cyanobacterium SM2_2_1]
MRNLLVLILALVVWLSGGLPAAASLQTLEESPGQVLVQSRHQLRDDRQGVWQAILFAREGQLNLRLVSFPGQYTVRHPAPLTVETAGIRVSAPDNFPKGDAVPNVGQFDLREAIAPLPRNRPWILTLPVAGAATTLTVPREVVLEWQDLAQPLLKTQRP